MRHLLSHVGPYALLFILGFSIRIAYISILPYGLNWDETSYAYNAYSVMTTGKDEWGTSYPILLRSFGDFKPALLSYLIIPFLNIFSDWNVAARFPVILLNSLAGKVPVS